MVNFPPYSERILSLFYPNNFYNFFSPSMLRFSRIFLYVLRSLFLIFILIYRSILIYFFWKFLLLILEELRRHFSLLTILRVPHHLWQTKDAIFLSSLSEKYLVFAVGSYKLHRICVIMVSLTPVIYIPLCSLVDL